MKLRILSPPECGNTQTAFGQKHHSQCWSPRGSHRAAVRKYHYPSYHHRNQARPTDLFWLSLSLCCSLPPLSRQTLKGKIMAAYHRLAPYNCFVFEYRLFCCQGSEEAKRTSTLIAEQGIHWRLNQWFIQGSESGSILPFNIFFSFLRIRSLRFWIARWVTPCSLA
jgi:hypothetical protein